MAIDVDAVTVFYEDLTFKTVTWENVRELQSNKRFVGLSAHIVTTAGSNPGTVTFHSDIIGAQVIPEGFLVRELESPPGNPEKALEHFFVGHGNQEQLFNIALPKPPAAAFGGMAIALYRVSDILLRNELALRIGQAVQDIANGPVPNSGTY